jgi:hypothetical protein
VKRLSASSARCQRVQLLVLLVGAVVAPMVYPAAPLDPQFLIVAQFTDAEGPAVRLANGRVFRLGKLAAPIVVIIIFLR